MPKACATAASVWLIRADKPLTCPAQTAAPPAAARYPSACTPGPPDPASAGTIRAAAASGAPRAHHTTRHEEHAMLSRPNPTSCHSICCRKQPPAHICQPHLGPVVPQLLVQRDDSSTQQGALRSTVLAPAPLVPVWQSQQGAGSQHWSAGRSASHDDKLARQQTGRPAATSTKGYCVL